VKGGASISSEKGVKNNKKLEGKKAYRSGSAFVWICKDEGDGDLNTTGSVLVEVG